MWFIRASVNTAIVLRCKPKWPHQDPFEDTAMVHLPVNSGAVPLWYERGLRLIRPKCAVRTVYCLTKAASTACMRSLHDVKKHTVYKILPWSAFKVSFYLIIFDWYMAQMIATIMRSNMTRLLSPPAKKHMIYDQWRGNSSHMVFLLFFLQILLGLTFCLCEIKPSKEEMHLHSTSTDLDQNKQTICGTYLPSRYHVWHKIIRC